MSTKELSKILLNEDLSKYDTTMLLVSEAIEYAERDICEIALKILLEFKDKNAIDGFHIFKGDWEFEGTGDEDNVNASDIYWFPELKTLSDRFEKYQQYNLIFRNLRFGLDGVIDYKWDV